MPRPRNYLTGNGVGDVYSAGEIAHILDCSPEMAGPWMDSRPEGVFRLGTGKRQHRRMTQKALMDWIETLPAWEQERRRRLLAEVLSARINRDRVRRERRKEAKSA